MKNKIRIYRKVLKFMVITITILTAELLSDFISNYLVSFKGHYKPIPFTLMAMGIIVIIFYPALEILDKWIAKFSKAVVDTGKSVAGRYTGLVLAFLVVLTFCYLQVWYDINLFDYLFLGRIKELF